MILTSGICGVSVEVLPVSLCVSSVFLPPPRHMSVGGYTLGVYKRVFKPHTQCSQDPYFFVRFFWVLWSPQTSQTRVSRCTWGVCMCSCLMLSVSWICFGSSATLSTLDSSTKASQCNCSSNVMVSYIMQNMFCLQNLIGWFLWKWWLHHTISYHHA